MSLFDLIADIVSDFSDQSDFLSNGRSGREQANVPGRRVASEKITLKNMENFDRSDLHRGGGMECDYVDRGCGEVGVDMGQNELQSTKIAESSRGKRILELIRNNSADAVLVHEILSKPLALRKK